jgi:hypothetical protein
MPIKIIRERQDHYRVEYTMDFGGVQGDVQFGFVVDFAGRHKSFDPEYGVPETYWKCIRREIEGVVCYGISEREVYWWEPAVGLCEDCGAEVVLQGFTVGCPGCPALYNSGGQRLCDPSEWGEETGEHPADLLRIP